MTPQHICHLSLLNPAVHPRIFYKLARSQQNMGHQLSIIGQDQAGESYEKDGIMIIPLPGFRRLGVGRLRAHFRLLKKAWGLKADVYTLHSPELLAVGWLLKVLRGKTILYDVHEDYARTIRHSPHYATWLRRPLAWLLRRAERLSVRLGVISGVSYAESSYDNILGLPARRRVVLRNSFQPPEEASDPFPLPPQPYLLYTGTLAGDWGVWETLATWQKLNEVRPLQLVMAGFTYDEELVKKIEAWVAKSGLADRFQLIGGNEYVPYARIVWLIRHCLLGTALYRLKPHIIGKEPTKFFEYRALAKPLLFTSEPYWNAWHERHQLGVPLIGTESAASLWAQIDAWQVPEDTAAFCWTAEEAKLKAWMER